MTKKHKIKRIIIENFQISGIRDEKIDYYLGIDYSENMIKAWQKKFINNLNYS